MTKRILIVEDNALVREMYRSALKSTGAQLIETQRGEFVQEIVRREKPDLVILDLILPDISGRDVAERLKASAETAGVPLLAVSNAVTAGDEASLKALGFAGLVTKPVDIRSFAQTVARFLGG
jgi:two-component system cell cycle response regulator DivK